MTERKFVRLFIFTVAIVLSLLAIVWNGTADSGDSVNHYLFSKWAMAHPENFFDAWAKPLYVLLTQPFVQGSFTGVKFFNILNFIVAMIATYLTAKKLELRNSWLVTVLLVLAPMNFALALSGLTEPLFGTVLICGLCLLFHNKNVAGLVVLSFLPFVRSEGMFMLIIIAAYLITQKKYVSIVWLAIGQALYAVIGCFKFHSLLWFYAANPYSLKSRYGHGDFAAYFNSLHLVIGSASQFFLGIGVLAVIITFVAKVAKKQPLPWQLVLIMSLFLAYFFFHVIAWKYGLFASFGMTRIIVAMAPLMAILCLYGLNAITGFIKDEKVQKTITIALVALIVMVNGIKMYKILATMGEGEPGFSIKLEADQDIEDEMAHYIQRHYPDYKTKVLIYDAPYVAAALGVDPFSDKRRYHLEGDGKMPTGSYLIWDDWFAVVEGGIKLEDVTKDNAAIRDTSFSRYDAGGKERTVILFHKN